MYHTKWINEYFPGVLRLTHKVTNKVVEIKIDNSDMPLIQKYQWLFKKYAITTQRDEKTGLHNKGVALHMLLNPQYKITDHINRDKTDNRRENLRECTKAENSRNRSIAKNNTSGIPGVHLNNEKHGDRVYIWWVATWYENNQRKQQRFHSKEAAVIFRKEKIKEVYGKFAPEIDHITAIGSVPKGLDGWDSYYKKLFVSADKMRALCHECHRVKSKEDGKKRREIKKGKIDNV